MAQPALDLLALLLATDGALPRSVIAQRCPQPSASLNRLLAALLDDGWIERVARGRYAASEQARRLLGGGPLAGQQGSLVFAGRADEDVLQLYQGFQEVAARQGFHAQLSTLPDAAPSTWTAADLERLLPAGPVRGVAFFADAVIAPAFMEAIHDHALAAVVIGQADHQLIDCVTVDFAHGCRAVIDTLVALGHRSIVYVHDGERERDQISLQWRRTGYEHALRQHGLQPEVWDQRLADFFASDAQAVLRKRIGDLRRVGRDPTAIFCGGPRYAEHLAALLGQLGLAVPADVAVVGTGSANQPEPLPGGERLPIGYLREPLGEAGRAAARCLLARLIEPDLRPSITLIPPVLSLDALPPVATSSA